MENKKQYIQPELKSVEFEVELGFAASGTLSQSITYGGQDNNDNRIRWNSNPFGVSLHGNNDDWD